MMMGELQARLKKRQMEQMTPEERKKMEDEEAAKNAALRTGGVESKLAMLNAQMGGQDVPQTKVMVNKNAPPPPPPPPPAGVQTQTFINLIKVPPPPPGGAKPKPKPPASKPAASFDVTKGLPPPPPIPKAQPQQQTQTQTQPQQQSAPSYPVPGQQQIQAQGPTFVPPPSSSINPSQQQEQAQQVEYPMPQKAKKEQSSHINIVQAITKRNLMQEMNKIDFANKDQVLKLYPPDHNKNPRPSFKSIMEGLRKLDVNPEEAVMYFTKKAKATQNFQRFFLNDNNTWSKKQANENLDHLRKANKAVIDEFAASAESNQVQNESQAVYEELNVVRFNAAIQRIQAVIETKVKTQQFSEIGKLSALAQQLEEEKKSYDSAPAGNKNACLSKINNIITQIESLQ